MLVFDETKTPKQAIDSTLEPFLEEFSSVSSEDYKQKLTRGGSTRTGNPIRGTSVRRSINIAGAEYPQEDRGDLVESTGYRRIGPRLFKVGHFSDRGAQVSDGQLKALAFGRRKYYNRQGRRVKINFQKRRFIQAHYNRKNIALWTQEAARKIP